MSRYFITGNYSTQTTHARGDRKSPRHRSRTVSRVALGVAMGMAVAAVTGVATQSAYGDWVGDTNSDWNTAANWGGDVFPTNPNDVIVNNTAGPGVFPVISGNAAFTPRDIRVGTAGGIGRVDHLSGTIGTGDGNWFFLGYLASNATYNLANTAGSGGALTGFGQGSGSLNIGGATQNGNFLIGLDNGTVSTLNINTTGSVFGAGMFLGAANGSNGNVNLDNGTVSFSGEIQVGANFFSQGSGTNNNLNVSGGTLTGNIISLARGANNAAAMTGTANITGGVVNSKQWFTLGFAGSATNTAVVNNNGGTINVNTSGGGVLEMGVFDATNNTFNQNSGNTSLQNNAGIVFGSGGNHTGTSTFNQNGGGVTFYSNAGTTVGGTGSINLGNGGSTGNYTYNLNGGTLTVPTIQKTAAGASGTFNFNGGTLKPTANNSNFIIGLTRANVRNGGAIIDTNGFNVAISPALNHSNIGGDNATDGGVTKNGAGALTVDGVNDYTGNTTINGGSLVVGVAGAINSTGAINVLTGGRFVANNGSTAVTPTVTVTNGSVDGVGIINTVNVASSASNAILNGFGGTTPLTIGTLTLSGAANFNLNVATTSPVINATTISTNGSGNVLVNATNANWSPGTYNLISYGSLNGAFTAFQKGTISGLSGRQSATLTNPAGFISLVIAGDNPKWTGALNSSWTTATLSNPKNWQLITSGSPTDYINGDVVLFDDTASNFTVNVTDTTVTPTSTTFNNGTNYIVNGPGAIAGSGGLTKSGSGALTINNGNTYSAGTTLNAGTLNINHASAIGSGNLTIAAGTTIDNTGGSPVTLSTNNNQAWNGDFTFGGSNALNMGNGTATINANRTVTVNGSNLTVARIAQSGVGLQLTKAGPGTLTISGTGSSYSGATNVTGGTLAVTGALTSSSAINVTGGSVVSASGTLSAGIVTINNGSAVVSGTMTSTGDFWVARGNGSVGDLQVQNGATVNADVLLVAGGDGPTNVATATATIAAGGTVNTTRWFVAGHSGIAPSNGTVDVNGNLNVRTSGAQGNIEVGTWDTMNANLNINSGAVVKLENNADIVMGAQTHSGTGTITQNGGGVTFYSDGGVTPTGTGNLVMGGAAGSGTYTYNLNGGTLTLARIRKDNGTANSTFNFNGGTLKPTGNQTAFVGGLTRANVRNGGAIIDTNGFNVTVSQALEHSNVGGDNAIDGGLTKNGAGTLVVGGVATYTGATTINAGILQLPPGAAPVAVGRYNFDELSQGSLAQNTTVLNTGSGGVTFNGNVNHLDNQFDPINGGASVVASQAGYGNALALDGLGSTVDIAGKIVDQPGNGSWTVSAWIKTATNGSSLLSKNASGNTWAGGHSVFYLGTNPISGTTGTLPTAVRNGGGFIQGNTPVVDDVWHMVTYVDNGGVKTIYVDGVAAAMNYTGFDNADTSTFVRLGFNTDTLANLDGNANFAGLMDEMRFYNVTLTSSQVAALFATNSIAGGGQQYLPATTPLSIVSSATLDLNGNNQIIGSLSGPAGSAVALGTGTLTTNGNDANTTFGGVISGSGGLTKVGNGTLTLQGANAYTGATTVNAGVLRVENNLTSSSSVQVSGGSLVLPSNGTQLRVIKTGTVLTSGTGKIDISDNKLIATASPAGTWNGSAYTGVTGLIASGRNGNTAPLWDGATGIITSQTQAAGGNLTSIGVAKATDVRPATATATALWAGQTITGTDTLVMYTYGGDATLDGKINIDDYVKIDSGIAGGYTGWVNGDFNYDGKVSIDDYITVIDANIGNQSGVFPTAGGINGGSGGLSGVSAVPEPASLSMLLGLTSASLLRRRRRQQR